MRSWTARRVLSRRKRPTGCGRRRPFWRIFCGQGPSGEAAEKSKMNMQLSIIKIGGNIIDDEAKLAGFLDSFGAIPGKKILVHGGGKLATKVAEGLGIRQQLVDGRRITDAETLKVVTMVYAGTINKNIVAQL